MSRADFIAILPFLVLAAAIVVIMLTIAVRRHHSLTFGLALVGAVLSLASLGPASNVTPRYVTALFVVDGYALFYIGLVLIATIAVLLLSYGYLSPRRGPQEEFYLLVLLATLGATALVASDHFASFFVSLEILSISLLGLIAYPRLQPSAVEAGIKYLILAGLSSALLLFGMALIYARLGTLAFVRIATLLHEVGPRPDIYWLTGLAMIVTGIGFKLSLVPFHMWAPDIYQGAPAPVTAFVAVVSKGAVFALLLRYFRETGAYESGSALLMINAVAVASMLIGNLLALQQNNVKRILAYSSIGHLGYLLVAFLAGGTLAVEAATYYLVAYSVMTLGAFGIVAVLSTPDHEAEMLEDYRGLFWRRPWLAGVFTAMLLSLAGIPLTVGFMAKFYAVAAGVSAEIWPAIFALVVGSVIGLFYYLRVIVVMSSRPGETVAVESGVSWPGSLTLVVLSLMLTYLGIYPSTLLSIIRLTALRIGSG